MAIREMDGKKLGHVQRQRDHEFIVGKIKDPRPKYYPAQPKQRKRRHRKGKSSF